MPTIWALHTADGIEGEVTSMFDEAPANAMVPQPLIDGTMLRVLWRGWDEIDGTRVFVSSTPLCTP